MDCIRGGSGGGGEIRGGEGEIRGGEGDCNELVGDSEGDEWEDEDGVLWNGCSGKMWFIEVEVEIKYEVGVVVGIKILWYMGGMI